MKGKMEQSERHRLIEEGAVREFTIHQAFFWCSSKLPKPVVLCVQEKV